MINRNELIDEIVSCTPSNEAEVETKILLNIFKLLGFTHHDRADKITVEMYFGREKKNKVADFILYKGTDRTAESALIAVEAKKIGESLEGAEKQVISYSAWAGTPYYMVCNGEKLLISQNNPQSVNIERVLIDIKSIKIDFDVIYSFANKTKVLINKERIDYINTYYPKIELLPTSEFFSEYLSKLKNRFSYHSQITKPLTSIENAEILLPITIEENGAEYNTDELANKIIQEEKLLLIEGSPGSGKTTMCSRVTVKLIELINTNNSNVVPIYISLRNKVPSNTYNAFEFSCRQLGVRVFPEMFKTKLEESSIIAILDGFDEIIDIESGIKNLKKMINHNDIHSLIITSRPHVIDKLSSEVVDFAKCYVKQLSDYDIKSVADEFNVKIDYDSSSSLLDLSSPLQLLMYIKLKQEGFDERSATIYKMYIEYITVLTKYFNNKDDKDYLDGVLNVLKYVSVEVVRCSNLGLSISINDMYLKIIDADKEYFSELIRCGIITSKEGGLNFLHKSFEEFGVAYGLVQGIKNNDEAEIRSLSMSSWNSYYIASTGLHYDDITNIVSLLDSQANRVKKKIVGVLKYTNFHHYPELRFKLLEVLKREKSKKVVRSIFRILVNTEDIEVFLELLKFENIEIQRKEYYISLVDKSFMIDEVIYYIEKYFETLNGKRMVYWMLVLTITSSKVDKHSDSLVRMILKESFLEQLLIFEKLILNRDTCKIIIEKLYSECKSRSQVLRLLHADRHNITEYKEEELDNIINSLRDGLFDKQRDKKRIREILSIGSLTKEQSEVFECLLV